MAEGGITTAYITEERIREYLDQGKRFDGRGIDNFRDIIIEPKVSKKAEGSARVKIGKTEVIVGVKMDVTTPYPDSPDKGNLMVTAELLPLSSDRIGLGRPGFNSIEIGRVIDRAIRESKFIELDKLCITPGEKVWNIMVDIYSINDDGNLLDAAGIGAIVALSLSKIPKYDEEAEKVIYEEHTESLPLSDNMPLSLTFHKIGDKFIVDPTREEEDVSETRVTIGSHNGVISSMQKGQEHSITEEEFANILDRLDGVWNEVFKKIEKHLK